MFANSKLVTNNLKFPLQKPKTFWTKQIILEASTNSCKSPKFQTTSCFADEQCPNNSKHLPREGILIPKTIGLTNNTNFFLEQVFSHLPLSCLLQ